MPCKVVLYFNQATAGWSETYYHPTSDPAQLATNLPNSFFQSCVAFRHNSVLLQACRISDVNPPRKSVLIRIYPKAIGQRGTVLISNGPDVVSTDAVFLLQGDNNSARRIFVRGLADNDVLRDGFGSDSMSAQLRTGSDTYFAEIVARGFCTRKGLRPPNGGLTYVQVSRVALNEASPADQSIVWFNSLTFPLDGDYVTFAGHGKGLPHFPTSARIISHTDSGVFRQAAISYKLPGGVSVFPNNMRGFLRSYEYDAIRGWSFERFSEHKTGRPFGSLRGRARVA